MRLPRYAISFLCLAPLGMADLTQSQKVSDFMDLAGLYATQYAPYQIRKDVFGFDLFNLAPWLTQISASKSDMEFFDICTKYVASLQDSHDEFLLLSDFDAWLHFNGDLYDGVFLIDYIDRGYLPKGTYGFNIGDTLVSVDGVAVADLIKKFVPYSVNGSGNVVSQQRLAAATITERYQGWNPIAPQIQTNATIVVHGRASGQDATYTIPWDVLGTPLTSAGIIPSFGGNATPKLAKRRQPKKLGLQLRGVDTDEVVNYNPWGIGTEPPDTVVPDPEPPAYMSAMLELQNGQGLKAVLATPVGSGLSPFDSFTPIFNPPAGFALRLGAKSTDEFLSGTFPSGSLKIGYLRIPSFSPTSTTNAYNQFAAEVSYFQANTDGLVLDVMANGGGSLCYAQNLASFLIPTKFKGVGEQIRATTFWQYEFSSSLTSAKLNGAAPWIVNLYSAYLKEVQQALTENRGVTGALPLCSYTFDVFPVTTSTGALLAYTKPILLLTDNFTLSSAETFAMLLQDNKRATLFGTRTDGGGGNVNEYTASSYSISDARVTQGLITRLNPVAIPGFPSSIYYDGVGIQPDITQDYQTFGNLSTGGAPFVQAVTTAITTLIANAGH